MTGRRLGAIGAVIEGTADGDFAGLAAALERLGYGTIWLAGGRLDGLDRVRAALDATETATIATAIIAADRFDSDAVLDLYRHAEASHPGRLLLGLGGAHGPRPRTALGAYLDRLDGAGVPADARVLAALGPRMLELARDRTAGALPVLVTPAYTASARATLGGGTLAVQQLVALEPDPGTARRIATGPIGFLRRVPGYAENFRRMGFTDDDIEGPSDRLVDGLVACGDAAAIARRVDEHRRAGADHVALMLVNDGDRTEGWETLIRAVGA